MKKVAFILAGLLAMMLAGCGEGSSSASSSALDGGASEEVVIVETVDAVEAETTTPKTPYNLSSTLGTPPGLPQ